MNNRKTGMLLLLLSGTLTGLAVNFSQYLGFLAWFSLCPAVYALYAMVKERAKFRRFYLAGLLYFFAYYLVAWHFFCYMYPLDFTGIGNFMSIVVIFVAWFGLSFLQAAIAALAFWLFGLLFSLPTLKERELLMPLGITLCYTVLEWAQNFGWWGVPWARLSLSQINYLPIMQSASLFGSYFITMLIVFVNAGLSFAFARRKDRLFITKLSSVIALSLFALNLTLGIILYSNGKAEERREDKYKVAVIQGNFSSKDETPSYTEILDVYELYTARAARSGAKLAVWPETAIPYYTAEGGKIEGRIARIARDYDIGIIFGALRADEETVYNCAFYAHPNGEIDTTIYKKRHLVPFGEYMPMRGLLDLVLPFMEDINMLSSDMTAGEESEIFTVEGIGDVGALICFDSIYESLSSDSVRDGAQLFALGTNDSWFSDSAGVYLHLNHARLRSIEFGRYTVRAAVTGVSCVISPTGEVLCRGELLTEDYECAYAGVRSERTLYSYVGNLIIYLALSALSVPVFIDAIGAIVGRVRAKRNERGGDEEI